MKTRLWQSLLSRKLLRRKKLPLRFLKASITSNVNKQRKMKRKASKPQARNKPENRALTVAEVAEEAEEAEAVVATIAMTTTETTVAEVAEAEAATIVMTRTVAATKAEAAVVAEAEVEMTKENVAASVAATEAVAATAKANVEATEEDEEAVAVVDAEEADATMKVKKGRTTDLRAKKVKVKATRKSDLGPQISTGTKHRSGKAMTGTARSSTKETLLTSTARAEPGEATRHAKEAMLAGATRNRTT